MESSRRRAVMMFAGLIELAGGSPAFTTIHIGAFRPLDTAANS